MVLLNNRNMAGPNTDFKNMGTQVVFGRPSLIGGVTVRPTWIGDAEWLVADFGGAIPLMGKTLYLIIMEKSYRGE